MTESKKVTATFVGYQALAKNGVYVAMYEVAGLEGYSSPTTLLEPTLRKKGIAIPAHPTYEHWKQQRKSVYAAETH